MECVGSRNLIAKWNMQTEDFSYELQDNGYQNKSAHRFSFSLCERSQMSSRHDLAKMHGLTTIVPNMWIHVAATFDGMAARLYVNGSLDGTQAPATGRIHSGTTDILIGSAWTTFDEQLGAIHGLIDELCLYDRALAPDEIEAIYRAGSAGKIKPATAPIARPIGEGPNVDGNK